jgi:MoxR-like ATPase
MNDHSQTALEPRETLGRILNNVQQVISGQAGSLRIILAALASGGHVLLEDFPGTGKTTLAKAIAHSLGATFRRVQFTPDLLPSDILGVSVFNPNDQQFDFRAGPIFTDVLLADEINRASPRTQSALLEAMPEGQVSVEGRTMELSDLFFVIATQNPVEFRGTYPLPEAQMDRFAVRLSLGYVSLEEEVGIVSGQNHGHPLDRLEACVTPLDVQALRRAVSDIHVDDTLQQYAVQVVRATRELPSVQMGAGPRASLSLIRAARALALLDGSDFVNPDQLQELMAPVLAHRIIVDPQSRFSGVTSEAIVRDLIEATPVPV